METEKEFMLQELWRRIETAGDKELHRTISDVAQQYDDIMLGCPVIPDEGVEFLVRIFSCDRVLHAKGIEHFLLEINVDLCKYTDEQRMKILRVLVENAWAVRDELGRHSIGDFIARAYPPDLALATLLVLEARTPAEKHVAFVGLDVLRMRVAKGSALYKKIDSKWLEILGSRQGNGGKEK